MCKSIKKPQEFQVTLMIDVINDKAVDAMNVDFISETLAGVLQNYERDDIKDYDEVSTSLIVLGLYTKNPHKVDLDLKN